MHPRKTIQLCLAEISKALSETLLLFSLCFFDLLNTFCFVFVFSPPEQHAQHLKDKAGWCTQALSSIGVAGREEGQQDDCDRAHVAAALN